MTILSAAIVSVICETDLIISLELIISLLPLIVTSSQIPVRFAISFSKFFVSSIFKSISRISPIPIDFFKFSGDDLARDWFGQVQAWCGSHGLHSSGHLLWEEATPHHVPLYGNFLRCLMRLDIPGIDVLNGAPAEGCRQSRRGATLAMSAR